MRTGREPTDGRRQGADGTPGWISRRHGVHYSVMQGRKQRPVFLNLFRIHFPVTAVVSIGHRISGVLLFLAVPFAAWLLHLSLEGPEGYAAAAAFLAGGGMHVVLLILLWMQAHHLYAGVRYLLIDLDLGVDLVTARRSAWAVIAGAILTLFVGAWLLP